MHWGYMPMLIWKNYFIIIKIFCYFFVGIEKTYLIVIQKLKIVFVRIFSSSGDLAAEIKLSEQAVYMQNERCFLDIQEYVIFTYDDSNKEKFEFATEKKVQWVDVAKYKDSDNQNDGLFLATGLGMYHSSCKALACWNVAKKPLTRQESFKRSVCWIVPILILFLPLYYYADYYRNQSIIRGIESEIGLMASQVSMVNTLSKELIRAKNVSDDYAGPCLEYAKFYEMLMMINENRPKNLWLSSIAGKIDKEIIVTGYAQDFADISTLIRKLDMSEFIESLNLNYSNESSLGKVSYQLTININSRNEFILGKKDDLGKLSSKQEADTDRMKKNKKNKMNKTGKLSLNPKVDSANSGEKKDNLNTANKGKLNKTPNKNSQKVDEKNQKSVGENTKIKDQK